MNSPSISPNSILRVEDVSFAYEKEQVLDHIRLGIDAGDFLALIGPNGGGKSTLVRLMLGLLKPQKGKVVRTASEIGYVPQNTDINTAFPITAQDVVLLGSERSLFGYGRRERQKAQKALEAVDMGHHAESKIGTLSGGQRQRVMIARALQGDPKILMLDEPTSNIDPEGQREIYDLLQNLNDNMTIIVVSHDISVVVQYAQKVAYVNRTLTFHDISSMRNAFHAGHEDHFCEVELLRRMHDHD